MLKMAGGLRLIFLMAVCLGVVRLGHQSGAFFMAKEGTVLQNVPTLHENRPSDLRKQDQKAADSASLLTRSLRVPEDKSRGLLPALEPFSQAVHSLFAWRPSFKAAAVIPRRLTEGSRDFARASALILEHAKAADTLGALVTTFANEEAPFSQQTPPSRRFLAQSKSSLAARVVSVRNVREGQTASVEVELVDRTGHVIEAVGSQVLNWHGSAIISSSGEDVSLEEGGLQIGSLQQGIVVVLIAGQQAGEYHLFLNLNGQVQAPIPLVFLAGTPVSRSIPATLKLTARSPPEDIAADKLADKVAGQKASLGASLRQSEGFPGWQWLVGGVCGFAAVALAAGALYIQKKRKQLDGAPAVREPTASEQEAKQLPESLESSGEIQGPQAFLWAVQETGGPGLEEQTGRSCLKNNGKATGNSPRLLAKAVQRLREKNLAAAMDKNVAASDERQKADKSWDSERADVDRERRHVTRDAGNEAGAKVGPTLESAPKTILSEDSQQQKEAASRRRNLFLALESISQPSAQGAQGSALWSPLTFKSPSLFADPNRSRKRRSPRAESSKPKTPTGRKMRLFSKEGESKQGRQKNRELWSPVRFVSPPLAKPGKIRKVEMKADLIESEENRREVEAETEIRKEDANPLEAPQPKKAHLLRPAPLDIPGTSRPPRQSALWSPVKSFGSSPRQSLGVASNKENERGVLLKGKENLGEPRKHQASRFKKEKAAAKLMSSVNEETTESGRVATPLREEPSLWSPNFDCFLKTEGNPQAQVLSDGEASPKRARGIRAKPGRATLSSTSGAEIKALLQELERRANGQALSPFAAYEKLRDEDRKTESGMLDRNSLPRSLSEDNLGTPHAKAVGREVIGRIPDITLTAFVDI